MFDLEAYRNLNDELNYGAYKNAMEDITQFFVVEI